MNDTSLRCAYVLLTDPDTSMPVAVRVDQIVAIVPLKRPEVTLMVLLGENDAVMVKETTDEALERMMQAFRGPGDT